MVCGMSTSRAIVDGMYVCRWIAEITNMYKCAEYIPGGNSVHGFI